MKATHIPLSSTLHRRAIEGGSHSPYCHIVTQWNGAHRGKKRARLREWPLYWYHSGITNVLASAEVYDPAINEHREIWTVTNGMKFARSRHTATLLASGTVLVVGGSADDSSETHILASVAIYEPSAGQTGQAPASQSPEGKSPATEQM